MGNILTRKIKLFPVGDKTEIDRVFEYISNGMKAQNEAMNQYMNALYVAEINEASKEDRKELNRLYGRMSDSKKGSAYKNDLLLPKGLGSSSVLGQKVRQDFSNACKKGLMYGRMSLPTYRIDYPLLVHVDYVCLQSLSRKNFGIYHNYDSHADFLEHLHKTNLEVFIKFANNITFKMVIGTPSKSRALREELKQIFEENYKVHQSSISLVRKGKGRNIILNLSMSIPKKETILDENTVVGCDLGVKIPAVVALNNNHDIKDFFGDIDDCLRIRTKLQAERKRMQKSLKYANGGHGRKKKLKSLDKLKKRERNFVSTYNHKVSKAIVNFALKNKAKYINIEDLSGFKSDTFIYRNWGYFELQQYIIYKAQKHGVEVRKVNPYHTSQICSECGHWEKGQRDGREFECKQCGAKLHADFNAARNIAMSTDFR